MNAIDALAWLRRHTGEIRFHTDQTVTVVAYGVAKRALTIGDAMTAVLRATTIQADSTVRRVLTTPRSLRTL